MAMKNAEQTLKPGFELRSKERTYKIKRVLGAGSFGITYLVTSTISVGNISRMVEFAIKEHFIPTSCYRGEDGASVQCVPSARSEVASSRADFITEANRLKKLCLKSRNIVSVNETFESNGTAYYVMEYLEGGSPCKCPENEAVSIAMQVADALRKIHAENVLHLDLKPDNIVLKTNERGETFPVVIDFGISKHFDSKGVPTSSLSAKGASPGYAPQEQYGGVGKFSPKYDIYALGAVLFYLCTGKNPPDAFKVSPNQQELKKELDGKVSAKVEKAILNAMKPSASERTGSIQRFCDDLMGVDFTPVLNVSPSRLDFGMKKAQGKIRVDANIGWTVYSDSDWCKVSKSGNEISVSVSKNKETGNRSCNVVVNGAPYEISQTIKIKQEGVGTILLGPTWWDRHGRKVCQAGGVLLAGCLIAGVCSLFRTDPVKESLRLTEAIENNDGIVLKEFAENDSVRAYIPYAQYLVNEGRLDEATRFAKLASTTADSIFVTDLMLDSIRDVRSLQISEVPVEQTDSSEVMSPDPSPIQEEKKQVPKTETNDEKFAKAMRTYDIKALLALAQANYEKAYYPLAMAYYTKGDHSSAKYWANKATMIKDKGNRRLAEILLNEIENALRPSNDELFAKAKTIEDFEYLANLKYVKAYVPLAELYLKSNDYDKAHEMVLRAKYSNVDLSRAKKIVDRLAILGYYDNGEHGGKPNL